MGYYMKKSNSFILLIAVMMLLSVTGAYFYIRQYNESNQNDYQEKVYLADDNTCDKTGDFRVPAGSCLPGANPSASCEECCPDGYTSVPHAGGCVPCTGDSCLYCKHTYGD